MVLKLGELLLKRMEFRLKLTYFIWIEVAYVWKVFNELVHLVFEALQMRALLTKLWQVQRFGLLA